MALRWLTQSGVSFTVEARSAEHFRDDVGIFDFEMSREEMSQLEALNRQPSFEGAVTGPNA